jgi:hypothetical protein
LRVVDFDDVRVVFANGLNGIQDFVCRRVFFNATKGYLSVRWMEALWCDLWSKRVVSKNLNDYYPIIVAVIDNNKKS